MAKLYEIKNTTQNPARPIGLMTAAAGKDAVNTAAYQQVNTDDIPVTLTEGQYKHCEEAIKRYVKAGMMSCKEIGTAKKAPKTDKKEPDDAETALRQRGKELGISSWHVLGLDKLEVAIAEAEKEKED